MASKSGLLIAVLPLALAACGGPPEQVSDAELGNAPDPALTSALEQQIMVDPQLGTQSNGDAIRPPGQPYSGALPSDAVAANGDKIDTAGLMKAPAPIQSGKQCTQCEARRESLTLGGLAARQKDQRGGKCAGAMTYSASWANRLPTDLPLFPQARVTEAAGIQTAACQIRVVSFSTAQPMSLLLDWYYTKAVRAGYNAEHQLDGADHILGGTRDKDGGAYVLFMTARKDGGTDIDMVSNKGV